LTTWVSDGLALGQSKLKSLIIYDRTSVFGLFIFDRLFTGFLFISGIFRIGDEYISFIYPLSTCTFVYLKLYLCLGCATRNSYSWLLISNQWFPWLCTLIPFFFQFIEDTQVDKKIRSFLKCHFIDTSFANLRRLLMDSF
jgi:hypothetical protein